MQFSSIRAFPLLLIAAAWLGAVLCGLYTAGLVNGGLLSRDPGWLVQAPAQWMRFSDRDFLLVGLRFLLQLGALWQLRRIGVVWRATHDISSRLAAATRHLGHLLALLGLLGGLVPIPDFQRYVHGAALTSMRLGFQPLYLMAVGCLCIHSMAWCIDRAVALKTENEGFV